MTVQPITRPLAHQLAPAAPRRLHAVPDPRIRDFERLLAGLPTGPAVLIDVPGRRLLVDGAEVPLTLQEFDLVVYLARAAGRVVTREELYESAWHRQTLSPVTRTVDVHVRRVRAKSGLDALITTVRGVGYRLNPIEDLHLVG